MKVSIVIPAYNVGEYLAETLDSILGQTYQNFEVFVIDDGSSDNTSAIATHYAHQDDRIHFIQQENRGVSAARNLGIDYATGDLVAFLDGDDYWYPMKLAMHVEAFARSPKLGVSFGRVEFVDRKRRSIGRCGEFSQSKLTAIQASDLYYENLTITASNLVIRRSALQDWGGFDGRLHGPEDQEICLRMLIKGWEIEGIDQVMMQYRIIANSLSSNLQDMEREWYHLTQIIQSYAPELIQAHSQRAHAYFLRYLARRSIRQQNPATLTQLLIHRAIRTDWQLLFLQPKRTLGTLLRAYLSPAV